MRRTLVVVATCLLIATAAQGNIKQKPQFKQAMDPFPAIQVNPIGKVERQNDRARIEIRPELVKALKGLEGFSNVWVIFWFHENDRPEERAILQVHPRRDPTNPLTGVFATRAPVRPNLIGLTCCRIISIKENILEVEGLDARDGSPVLDLKPYIPSNDALPDAKVPWWVGKPRKDN
jgi:tRNA-Thr(GGU) m(6)t(6)A37 methyltransferase TsaA